jgi:pimeloyl-ACP methyl ester carboxylesterase
MVARLLGKRAMSTAKEDTLHVAGATLFYRVTGSGPTLLILPGGHGDADTADGPRNQLIDRYTVVTYDRRGLSRSTATDQSRVPVNVLRQKR